jgi:hypothetical protein
MTPGLAYGIFKSQCAQRGITSRLERMYKCCDEVQPLREPHMKTATRYRLHETVDVKDGTSIVKEGGQQLVAIAREWTGKGANYMLKLSIPDNTNEKTADDLLAFLGALCKPGPLIDKIGENHGAVYFREESGSYTCRIVERRK